MRGLESFIVAAKKATYVGGGEKSASCRVGSHDLALSEGKWSYLDSYFGGVDFLGQEVVWYQGKPVWAMNYYGCILRPDVLTVDVAGNAIKQALSQMYAEGRFLGGYKHSVDGWQYSDQSEGTFERFHGAETISKGDDACYELKYHGGLVKG